MGFRADALPSPPDPYDPSIQSSASVLQARPSLASNSGGSRFSHAGVHQLARPMSAIALGTTTNRTRVVTPHCVTDA